MKKSEVVSKSVLRRLEHQTKQCELEQEAVQHTLNQQIGVCSLCGGTKRVPASLHPESIMSITYNGKNCACPDCTDKEE